MGVLIYSWLSSEQWNVHEVLGNRHELIAMHLRGYILAKRTCPSCELRCSLMQACIAID